MIEEKFYNNDISHAVIESYLSDEGLEGIDALVLACTHYPLIKNEISNFYKHQVKIFDSAQVVAQKLKWILEKEGLTAEKKSEQDIFYVSDFTESFAKTTNIFYRKEIRLELNNIWKNL